jgi:hypothetical protein
VTTATATFGRTVTPTMFAALYGELRPVRRPGGVSSEEARRLFLARSAAMGWLTPTSAGSRGGLWGMSEVGLGAVRGAPKSCVARFRVALTSLACRPVPPVQPLLSCAGETVARLGTLRLDEVQVLLPERGGLAGRPPDPSCGSLTARPLLTSAPWFDPPAGAARVPVRLTLDGGPDPQVRMAAAAIDQSLRSVRQDVFEPGSYSLSDDDHLVLWAAPLDRRRRKVAHHRVSFSGSLAEWSLDAVGWLAAFYADLCSRCGVTTPMMFSASRLGTPAARAGDEPPRAAPEPALRVSSGRHAFQLAPVAALRPA